MKRRRRSTRLAAPQAPALTGPRVTLDHLPSELLQQIFSYFCSHCCPNQPRFRPPAPTTDGNHRFRANGPPAYHRLEILRSLCLLSRRIRPVAQEVLFHVFSATEGAGKLVPFVCAVIERPDLASAVRVMKVSHLQMVRFDPIPPSLVAAVSRQAAQARGLDLCRSWRGRIQNDEEWPPEFQTLLKSFLDDGPTRTRVPKTVRPEVMQEWLMGELFTLLMGSLPRLESLYFQNHMDMSFFHPPALRALGIAGIPIKKLEIFAWAPTLLAFATNLEALSLTGIEIMYRIPPLPRLKELEIKDVWLSLQQTRYLFSMCTGQLRSVLYESHPSLGPSRGRPIDRVFGFRNGILMRSENYESTDLLDIENDEILIEPEQAGNVTDVLECIKNHRQSITCLQLHIVSTRLGSGAAQDFRPFIALRHLTVHLSILGNVKPTPADLTIADILPPSIESITFRGMLSVAKNMEVFECHMDRVVQMVSRIPGPLPNLTRIICNKLEQYPAEVVHKLASVGVHFSHVPQEHGWSASF